jgi:hypothetical protein
MAERQSSFLAGDSRNGSRQLRWSGGSGALPSAVGPPSEAVMQNQWSPQGAGVKIFVIYLLNLFVFVLFGLNCINRF